MIDETIEELKQIKQTLEELQEQYNYAVERIVVLEKALELAVETMRYELGRDAIKNLYKEAIDNLSSNLNMKFDTKMCEWFIEQAKEELENDTTRSEG